MKSTDINNQLDKCKADLSHNMKALVEQKELGDKSERNYHAELARAATLAADLSASQKKILMIEGDHNSHNIERSEEAKKGAYIINVLTSELKISRGKIADMDRMQDDLQRANDDLRASLTKVREELSLSDQNVALGTVPKPDSVFSDSGTNTVIRAAVASSDANARATCDVSQQSKISEQEILLLRKEKEERQDGKLVLLKKGDASSLHNEALFELTKDLSALEVEKNDTNRVIELSQKNLLSLPPPPSSIGIQQNQGEDNSSYSSTYSRTRNTCIPSYMGSTSSSSPPRHRTKTSVPQKSTQRGHCIEKIDTRSNKMLEVEEIQSCPMTLRHHKWVNLPSLRNVSTLLHENITNIINDLQSSELMCLEVERKLAKSQLVIEELKTEHKNEILKYMTATKIRDREMVEMKTNLEMTERNLKIGLDVHGILDKITVAFLSAPGGYGMFSDDFDGSELLDFKHENDSKAVSNQLSDSEFYGTQSTEDRISSSANHSYHGQSLSRDRDSPSPDPRKSLTMKRTNNNHMYGNPASCSPMIFDDIPNQRTNRWKVEDFASQPLRNSCVQSLDCSISPQSLPEMVIKSVTIATCAIKKLRIADEMLSKSLADLQSIQSALRISKGECEHLFNQLEDAKTNNSKITFIYSDMERSLRKDLESATDLVERQNSLIVSSDAKVFRILLFLNCTVMWEAVLNTTIVHDFFLFLNNFTVLLN